MANSGGAWDNAKKAIEAGAEGGKGSKRTRLPLSVIRSAIRLRIRPARRSTFLIKLMSIVSVVLAALTAAIGQGFGLLGMLVN